jgi:periplasmic copper chaperone A
MKLPTTTERACASKPANGLARHICVLAAALLTLPLASAAAPAADGISVEKPWMRLIIKARPAAGYFTLKNDTDSTVTLTGASSIACGMLMLHQSKQENGIDKMLPVKSVAVPAHGTLKFAPGGYHLMCMSPQGTMAIGHTVQVILKFAGGKSVTADFPVKGPSGK